MANKELSEFLGRWQALVMWGSGSARLGEVDWTKDADGFKTFSLCLTAPRLSAEH